jgi:hypothetical protein
MCKNLIKKSQSALMKMVFGSLKTYYFLSNVLADCQASVIRIELSRPFRSWAIKGVAEALVDNDCLPPNAATRWIAQK